MCWNLLRYILKQVQWSILLLLGKEDILFINKCWLNWNLLDKSYLVWNGAMILGQKTALSECISVFLCQADYMLILVCVFTKCRYHWHLTMWFCLHLYIDYVLLILCGCLPLQIWVKIMCGSSRPFFTSEPDGQARLDIQTWIQRFR